jgi:formylglycine-generating enzyme required for sulfatase activity
MDERRLLRGGSWFNSPAYCRSASRNDVRPVKRDRFIGFRVCYLPQA